MPQHYDENGDLPKEKRDEIKRIIRDRAEKFANMKALPSTISGRHRLKNQMGMMKAMFNTSPSNWIGVTGMEQAKIRMLETEEERQFFDEQLRRQREASEPRLQRVLRDLMMN